MTDVSQARKNVPIVAKEKAIKKFRYLKLVSLSLDTNRSLAAFFDEIGAKKAWCAQKLTVYKILVAHRQNRLLSYDTILQAKTQFCYILLKSIIKNAVCACAARRHCAWSATFEKVDETIGPVPF